MIQVCASCQSQFDNLKQQSLCPHREFPKMCRLHERFHCGNFECNKADITVLRRKEKNG